MRKFLAVLAAIVLLIGSAQGATEIKWVSGELVMRDATLSPTYSMWDNCPLWAIQQDPSLGYVWYNDFMWYTTAYDGLASIVTDTGTIASGNSTGGQVILTPSDGTVADNDEAYLGGANDVFALATGNDLWFEARVKFTEANTDDANIIVGFCDVYAANTLQDNGAGPVGTYDGLVFFKVDGGTTWSVESSSGAATQTTLNGVASRVSGSWQRLGIYVEGTTSATFYVDGVPVGTLSTTLPDNNFSVLFGVKNGDTNLETLYVDDFKVVQLR